MTKFEEEFDKKVDIFNVIGNHNSMCCEVDRVKEVFKDWQPQQALPVVPECVAKDVKRLSLSTLADWNVAVSYISKETLEWLSTTGNINVFLGKSWTLCSLKINGFKVEKQQMFYIELPNVYGLSDSVFVSKVENGTILEFTKGKDYALAFTEQEIKSIDERYWQFAVPVEDGE